MLAYQYTILNEVLHMQQNNPKAIGGLVCGIVSLVLMLIGLFTVGIGGIVGLAVGVVGLVLSIMARKEMPSTMATAGLVISIVGVCLCAIFGLGCFVCYCSAVSAYGNAFNSLGQWAAYLD